MSRLGAGPQANARGSVRSCSASWARPPHGSECPWAFAKINGAATVRERSVPLKNPALPPASGPPKSRSAGLGGCFAETCGRLVYVFPGQLSSRPSPVGTNTLVCPSRRQAARRMFAPRSRGLCGPLLGQSFYGWWPNRQPLNHTVARASGPPGRPQVDLHLLHPGRRWFFPALGRLQRSSGLGVGPAGRADGPTSFSFVPGISCKLSCSFKEA